MADPNLGIAKILVVDDDQTSLEILQSILVKEGFIVKTAVNGLLGRSLAEYERPDLIIMDINMPVEDGLTACAALKTNANTSDIPVIFISSDEDVQSKINGFNVGGMDYITKPYQVLEVVARVRLQIRLYHSYRSMVAFNLEQLKNLTDSQKSILVQPEDYPDACFSVFYLSAQAAGGDFYDVIHAGAGIFDYIVADISGHNAGTALPTAALKALLRQNASMLYSPLENLNLVNRNLRPVLQEDQYFTLIYARLNRARMRLTLVNAGHPPAIIYRPGRGAEVISQSGDGLGLFETITLDVKEIPVAHGDQIFLFTDGLIEQDSRGSIPRRIGLTNVVDLINQTPSTQIDTILKKIQERLISDQANIFDDVVVLGFDVG
jgi:phosphoserine phosphatase RsbU/P